MQYEVSIDGSLCDFNPLRVCLQRASMRDPLKIVTTGPCGTSVDPHTLTTSGQRRRKVGIMSSQGLMMVLSHLTDVFFLCIYIYNYIYNDIIFHTMYVYCYVYMHRILFIYKVKIHVCRHN